MAGERLKVPGHTEVSAVCTHPEHTGKGYAAILMAEVMKQIRERSPVLRDMLDHGQIALVGGMYDLTTGQVHFYDN